jgi:hypothetical protein
VIRGDKRFDRVERVVRWWSNLLLTEMVPSDPGDLDERFEVLSVPDCDPDRGDGEEMPALIEIKPG